MKFNIYVLLLHLDDNMNEVNAISLAAGHHNNCHCTINNVSNIQSVSSVQACVEAYIHWLIEQSEAHVVITLLLRFLLWTRNQIVQNTREQHRQWIKNSLVRVDNARRD